MTKITFLGFGRKVGAEAGQVSIKVDDETLARQKSALEKYNIDKPIARSLPKLTPEEEIAAIWTEANAGRMGVEDAMLLEKKIRAGQ